MPYRIKTYDIGNAIQTVYPVTTADAVIGLGDALDAYREAYIDPELEKKIEDAPDDGKYVRTKGAWVDVSDALGGGFNVTPPPNDNKLYALTGMGWIDITSAVTILGLSSEDFIGSLPSTSGLPPVDNKIYAIRNGMWVDITSVLSLN